MCKCFCSILLNHSITLAVFFHWLMFKLVYKRLLILSSIALLILPNSFFAGLISRTVELFKKFSLWSFKVIKQLFLLLTSIRSNIYLSAFSIICFPLMSILFLMLLFVFLCVDVIAFFRILTYSSLVNRYMLDDLSAKVKVLSDWFIFLGLLSVDFGAGFSLFGILCSSPVQSTRIQKCHVLLLEVVF